MVVLKVLIKSFWEQIILIIAVDHVDNIKAFFSTNILSWIISILKRVLPREFFIIQPSCIFVKYFSKIIQRFSIDNDIKYCVLLYKYISTQMHEKFNRNMYELKQLFYVFLSTYMHRYQQKTNTKLLILCLKHIFSLILSLFCLPPLEKNMVDFVLKINMIISIQNYGR